MSVFLLVIFLHMGRPQVMGMRMPSMEACTAAMGKLGPELAKDAPGAVATCVELSEPGT